jgi:hypothetical protein
VRKLGAGVGALGLITSAMAIVAIAGPAGPAEAGIGCRIDSFSGNVAVHETPDTSAGLLGSISSYSYGGDCRRTTGAAYTACGGGSVYYEVYVSGKPGYTPEACYDWSYH